MTENMINPLLDVMSEIDDEIITNTAGTAKNNKKRSVMMIAAAAAAATLLTGAGVAAVVQNISFKSGFYIGEDDGIELPYKAPENLSLPTYEEVTAMWPSVTSWFRDDEWHYEYDVGLTVLPSEWAPTFNIPLLITDSFTEENWVNMIVTYFEGELQSFDIGYALTYNAGGERLYIRAKCFSDDSNVIAGVIDPETAVYEKVTLNDGSEGIIFANNPYTAYSAVFVSNGMIYHIYSDTTYIDIDGMKQILSDLGVL